MRRDDAVLDARVFNVAVRLAAGPHAIVAEAPGFKRWQIQVALFPNGHHRVVVPVLQRAAKL